MLKKSLLLDLCFAGMALIIFSNLNGVVGILFGIKAAFSSLILVFCLVIIYHLFRYKKITFPHYALIAAYGFLFVLGTITWMFFSHLHYVKCDYYEVFRNTAPALILVYSSYKYLIYINDRGKLINTLYFITFALLFVTLIIPIDSIFGVLNVAFKEETGGSRGGGFFGEPNAAGVHNNFTLCFVLFFVINSKRYSLLFLAFVPLVLYATVLTFSKAAMISAILILLIFLFYNAINARTMLRVRRRRFGLAVLIIFVAIIYSLPSIIKSTQNLTYQQIQRLEQIRKLASGEFNSETTTHRSDLWAEAIELISAKPITGYGLSGFSHLPQGRLGPHNTYLLLWGEGGLLAIIAFIIYISSVYYRGLFWVRDPLYRFLILSLFFVVTVQFYGALHTGLNNSELSCMIGIVFALIEIQRGKINHLRQGKYVGIDYEMKAPIYK